MCCLVPHHLPPHRREIRDRTTDVLSGRCDITLSWVRNACFFIILLYFQNRVSWCPGKPQTHCWLKLPSTLSLLPQPTECWVERVISTVVLGFCCPKEELPHPTESLGRLILFCR